MECVATFTAPYNLTKKELYEKVLSDIKAGNSSTINTDLYRAYCESLKRAVSGVLQSGEYGSRYFDMQQQLEANVSRFSAFKAYHATRLLQENEHPKIKKAILNTFNRYQVAEYNTTVARTRTAKQWNDFNADPVSNELYPNIKWLPSRSANPREEHRIFWGKVWAKDDPFWSENQPGNLWNCKCDWEETDEPATDGTYNYTPPAGLEGNPAETGEIFTDKASYLKMSESRKEEVEKSTYNIARNESLKNAIGRLKDVIIEKKTSEGTIQVGFNRKGLEHFQYDFFPNKWTRDEILRTIDTVLKNAEYVAEANCFKGNPMVDKFYYYKVTLLENEWFLNVRKLKNGRAYLYSMTDKIKKK
ncbi:MAG: hypothetical protein LBI45_05395 [Bacteroidales bacterium]|jgi:hypothetical protein|nr:hypothetical protein [Bacteroidales bacterium]